MELTYYEWCEINKNVTPLIRRLKSSLPEQYIGFYLSKVLGDEIEYQKQFDWLDNYSLDIYIPSLHLAIEYDGVYYHARKKGTDELKTSLCRSNGIYLIHIVEKKENQPKSRKRNEVSYYYKKNYVNIDAAIHDLFLKINKRYNRKLQINVDLTHDYEEIIAYIQKKYYQKSIAYVWPESKDYWLDEENGVSPFDILYTDGRWLDFKCPHCQKHFRRHMRYYISRKSLVPCDCETEAIERAYTEAIQKYTETGEIVQFDNSLQSRRLYDRMAYIAQSIWKCSSKKEAELYKKIGFDSQYIDVYLSQT